MLAGKWYIAKEMADEEERLTLTVKYGPFESERSAGKDASTRSGRMDYARMVGYHPAGKGV